MVYPLLTEYIEAIKSSQDNMDALNYLRPVLDDNGAPIMSSGNFAVVFKMEDTRSGKYYALKCFLRDQERRSESYRLISDELSKITPNIYLTSIKYYDKELFVDSRSTTDTEFPVLLMNWVDGVPLDKYLRDNINDQKKISTLAENFSRLTLWLLCTPIAHGDLKPDNILIRDNALPILVDYDGMFVPAMKGEAARELGSPDFRHPLRSENDFNEHIDDFSLFSILLSLKAIALKPLLLSRFGASDRLLFSEKDYNNPNSSNLFAEIAALKNREIDVLTIIFNKALSNGNLADSKQYLEYNKSYYVGFNYLNFESIIDTKVTNDDYNNSIGYDGMNYSRDKIRLLSAGYGAVENYYVKDDTVIICDKAFSDCYMKGYLNIPHSVIKIGDYAFADINRHKYYHSVNISDNLVHIGEAAFLGSSLESITIPRNVMHIGKRAFEKCILLSKIKVDEGNKYYDSRNNCNAIIETKTNRLVVGCSGSKIPIGITNIGEYAFSYCRLNWKRIMDEWRPNKLIIPDSVKVIEACAFFGCSGMFSLVIPNSVTKIGDFAFSHCEGMRGFIIPNGVTTIGKCAFAGCSDMQDIIIPDGVNSIADYAFWECEHLQSIRLPISVGHIGKNIFKDCRYLKTIYIPLNSKKHFIELCPEIQYLLKEIEFENNKS